MTNADFQENANKYKDMIFRIAFNYFGNAYDADDVVQDVILKLYVHEKAFLDESHLKNWLIRVSINRCKNILRSPWRKKQVNYNDITELSDIISNPVNGSEDAMIADVTESERNIDLFNIIMSLKEKYRIVLYLYYYEEYSITEIAEVLNVSKSVVTTRLSRAREILKNGGFFNENE